MKVDTNRLKKGTSELTPECRHLIEEMTARKSKKDILEFFETLRGWIYGKCELYHWIEILDRFDDILAEAAKQNEDNEFSLFCDTNYTPSDIRLLLYVINFTTLLIEHSFSRHLYNSIEHLTQLLSSINMDIVMCVLNLLYMFSKRSNFIPRLNSFKKVSLLNKLFNLAESWGGKDNGFSLAQCCRRDATMPMSSSTLYFEYYNTGGELEYIEVPGLDKMKESAACIAKVVCDKIPHLGSDQRMHILTRIRLAATFRNYRMRLHFVQARLQAISVLVYSNALQDNVHALLYPGFVEELVELLEMRDTHLVEIRAAALRTLTSIIHLDRNPHFPKKPGSRLSKIIEVTGAAVYHGFLPTLVRACINHLISIKTKELDFVAACSVIHQYTSPYKTTECMSLSDQLKETNQFPLSLATALFSFLYHLASYEAGGEALVSCGMMESLLRVINWPGVDLEHITFVTRAVRVIDLITNIDMHAFHNNNGLGAFIARLETEVNHCRQLQLTLRDGRRNKSTTADHDYLGRSAKSSSGEEGGDDSDSMESDRRVIDTRKYKTDQIYDGNHLSNVETTFVTINEISKSGSKAMQASTSKSVICGSDKEKENLKKITCVTQRAALLKSMLNFLKKSIQDNNGMRNIMEGSLPRSLRNIISNAEYYGPSLFLLATDVVTVHVFHEPSLLCTLQDSGLTDIVLQSILRKEFPATREVLGSLPNVFSALCLNTRGLEEFSSFQPFDRLFKVLLSPDYLVAMRRRRSSDPLGDTATNLGHSMDDLMKHHPSLRKDATKAIIKLLNELVRIGSDPHFICWRANANGRTESSMASQQTGIRHQNKDIGHGSGGDDDDDEEVSASSQQRNVCGVSAVASTTSRSAPLNSFEEREPIPLIDYILNVMKFLDAIISNGGNGTHCREFVSFGGLQPLLSILSLPNLPVDSPVTTTAQAVAPVCKSILNLAHETKVIEVAILKLSQIVQQLNPLVAHMTSSEGSILLKELLNCPKIEDGFSNAAYTPLLHSMSSVHGYVVMLTQICRGIHNDVRLLLLRKWGIDCIRGRKLLQRLAQLYTSLVWESTILLGMCTDENVAYDPDFNYGALWRINSCMHDVAIDKLTESLTNQLSQVGDVTELSMQSAENAITMTTAPTSATVTQDISSTLHSTVLQTTSTNMSLNLRNTNASERDENMEIDDDVVCLTPIADGRQSVQDAVIEVPDETISLDSSTSSSSSDSVVFVSSNGSRVKDADKVKIMEGLRKKRELKSVNNLNENNTKFCYEKSKRRDEELKHRERAIAQLRHTKALLAASSRFGRALAELFGNLVKLCVAVPGRQKQRGNEQETTIKFPHTEAGEIARVLSLILVNGFCCDEIVSPSVPKLKLTFLICSVGFTGPMLFDEKRFAFHLMLSHFCEEGGIEAFFEMFRWGLSYGCTDENKEEFVRSNEYPVGAGEFLDAWLLLLEKMVNPRAIFESPHIIGSRQNSENHNQMLEFEPIFYMIKIHTLALKTICGIWDKNPLPNYGTRMAESILTIVKHIVKSDAMLREKFEKRREEIEKCEDEERQRQVFRESIRNSVNMNHLKLFMDMGFSERHVNEALSNTNSIEQATDYLLNRSESANTPRIISVEQDEEDDELEENEDDDDVDEIDLLVCENSRSNINTQPEPQTQIETESRNKRTWKSIQLPDSALMEKFCSEAFDKAFNIMDLLPETVASGADLLAELYRRQPLEMKQKFLLILVQNITDWAEKILHNLKARDALNAARREDILIGRHGMKMYIRLKVGCLLLDETYKDLRKSFCIAIKHEKSLSTLIMLLHKIESTLQEQIALGAPPITPRWLQYLIEFIDSIDNAYLVMQRKSNMIAVTTKTWKWYDSSAGKWNSYSASNNNIIHSAFAAGERSVRITCGRQKYIINFNCMSQVNEGTGNHRPVIPGLKVTELGASGTKIESSIVTSSTSSESESDSEDHSENGGPSRNTTRPSGPQVADIPVPSHSSSDAGSIIGSVTSSTVGLFDADDESKLDDDEDEIDSGKRKIILHEEATGLQQYDTGAIVSCLTRLLRPRLAIDLDTINSILKLCVRLTKEYENAKVFAQNDGIKLLLNMRQMCGYMGSPTYAILLIRHALEEPQTLLTTMEKEIVSRTLSTVPSVQRDIIYVLRQMSSAVARDPKTFIRAASNVLRLDYTVLKNKSDCYDQSRLIVKASPIKKTSTSFLSDKATVAGNSQTIGAETEIVESVINDLLKALVLPCKHFLPPPCSQSPYYSEAKPPLFFGGLVVPKTSYVASDASFEKTQVDDSQSEQCCSWHLPSVAHLHDKPLLSRSRILKILTDAVRSYQAFIPKIIIDHIYAPSDSVLIKEEQSALSFILDQFLPHKENLQDREVSTMARILITSLSECVDQSVIQNKVIAEIKMAILRAADLIECPEKHLRLQVFVSLLPAMIENPIPLNVGKHPHRTEIFLIMLRKGLMTDLSKMILYLDLSNPSTVATLNAVLKPMETLLRLTISPALLSTKKKTSQLQCARRSRVESSSVSGGRGSSSSRQGVSRRSTTTLEGGTAMERPGDADFFFSGDLARSNDQFNHIFDGILENEQEFFNGTVVLGRTHSDRHHSEGLNDTESQNVDVAFETSSESSDSESNASEDNEDREEDDDANEEQGEDRSEADVDEETRQFIEVFDHVYAPDQPRSSSNDRHLDGVPIIRYTVSTNLASSGSGAASVSSASGNGNGGVGIATNDNRISNVVNHVRQHRSSNNISSRSFNPIQHQRPNINIGIIRSTPTAGASMGSVPGTSSSINDDLIARFNYYIHHGQQLANGSGAVLSSNMNVSGEISNGGSIPTVSANLNANSSTTSGVDNVSDNQTGTTNSRLSRDAQRLLFVDQQYCSTLSFNIADESQGDVNKDALYWWLEEAKHLDMESQPDICLTTAHQLIPNLQDIRDKANKRKRKANFSVQVMVGSPDRQDPGGNNRTPVLTLSPTLSSTPLSVLNRRSAIPVLLSRNTDQRDTSSAITGSSNASFNDEEMEEHDDGNTQSNVTRLPNTQTSTHRTAGGQSCETSISTVADDSDDSENPLASLFLTEEPGDVTVRPAEADLQTRHQSQIGLNSYSIRQQLNSEVADPAMVSLPDDDDEEDDDLDDDDDDEDEDEHREGDNDENEENEDEDDDEEDLNVEDVIMDFDDEIQNVLQQFSTSVRPQGIGSELVTASINSSDEQRSQVSVNQLNRNSSQHNSALYDLPLHSRSVENESASLSISTSTNNISYPSQVNNPTRSSLIPNVSTSRSSAGASSQVPEMSAEVREVLGDLQVPEGVDPSFLAALPVEMREEVIQEHLRAQRSRQRAQQNAIETEHESLVEVNPDFLAALPPNIQAEVLSQQRIEQQRQAAQTANPNDPVDAAAFFQNLQPSLRQAILTDMEDSQIASLPPDLVVEAQNLRRDWEHRNRQVMQERLGTTQNNSNSSPSLGTTSSTYIPPRIPSMQSLRDRPGWQANSIWYNSSCSNPLEGISQQQQGRSVALALMENEGSLLDVDALTSLLLMLFIEDGKFNIIRLHRVIRHLCYHVGTREWIIDSLIAIIRMADETDIAKTDDRLISKPQHLNLRVDGALGYRSSVLLIKHGMQEMFQEEPYCGVMGRSVRIHPQAAQMVCRNALDLLITLARHFPRDFVPFKKSVKSDKCATTSDIQRSTPSNTKSNRNLNISGQSCTKKSKKMKVAHPSAMEQFMEGRDEAHTFINLHRYDFFRKYPIRPPTIKKTPTIFDVILKLDGGLHLHKPTYSSKEVAGMFVLYPQPQRAKFDFLSFEDSPFGQLLSILPSNIIKQSQHLTDKLVRLLSSLGMELPKEEDIQPFAVEDDPIDVAELSVLDQPSIASPLLHVLNSNHCKPPTNSSKSAEVINVHDSDSEAEKIDSSDDEFGNEHISNSSKQRRISKIQKLQISLYPTQVQHLKIAIEVLTTKSCSEEGLEYASELIVHFSQCSGRANAIVVQLLIRGIMGLAELVRKQIIALMKEVKEHNRMATTQKSSSSKSHTSTNSRSGVINDRFTSSQVVISVPTKGKPTCELQLPSMAPLVAKSSSQAFFLRTLKVFMQVRDLIEYMALLTLTEIDPLSEVICLDELWNTLSECLVDLETTNDPHAVLILQPAVEAFFLIHASKKKSHSPTYRQHNQLSAPRTGRTDTFPPARRPIASVATTASELSFDSTAGDRLQNSGTIEETMDQGSNDSNAYVYFNPSTTSSTTTCSSNTAAAVPSTSAAATAAAKKSDIQKRDQQKFLEFAEKHRTVLNQILRQSTTHLSDGPFSVLVDHTRILDFDVKRKYFRTELERMDEGIRREELTVNVKRVTVFEDSFRELYRRGPEEWKNRFYIVFEDEEGQDAGGLLREWYVIISREIFNPMYALFCVSPGDRVTYMINPSSHANPNHLCYFKFVGRVIAKAIHDNKLLECYFTRSFYKHILGIQVKYTDMESQDYEFYKGLAYLMNNDISTLGYDLTFSTEVQEFGVTQVRDLKPNGRNIPVTEDNKFEYIRLVCQLKMSGSIRQQLNAFLEGFYDIIPKRLISIFNEQELELLISGLPNVDIEDLKQNTEYHKYNSKSLQIQWFWRALRSFDQADRAKFLQFVTGTSKVPLQGFSALEGMNGIQKFQIHRDDRSTDRLPCAHTCFNQLDLPLYKSYEKLRMCLTKAIHECSEGFGFA